MVPRQRGLRISQQRLSFAQTRTTESKQRGSASENHRNTALPPDQQATLCAPAGSQAGDTWGRVNATEGHTS